MKTFIEQLIIAAIRLLLAEQVNQILNTLQFEIPQIEFGEYCGSSAIVPIFELNTCERTEKERILRIAAYSMTITFSFDDTRESELYCYAYAAAIDKALTKNPTLDGVANRAVITGKKYCPPKKLHCGENRELILSVRVIVENEQ
jgi:hypothetical protein